MLSLLSRETSRLCDGLSRREALRIGGLGAFGLTLPNLLAALAGGGVKGGIAYGSSDKIAGYPKDGRVLPQDLHATIYHCLGISQDAEIHDSLGRPLPVCRGDVIRAIV